MIYFAAIRRFSLLFSRRFKIGSLIFINPNSSDKNEWLYVGKLIESSGRLKGALVIATPTDRFLTRLAYREYSPYPLRLSLIDAAGDIFLSSEKGIEGKHFAQSSESMFWIPQADQPNSWILQTQKGSFLAVKIPIEGNELYSHARCSRTEHRKSADEGLFFPHRHAAFFCLYRRWRHSHLADSSYFQTLAIFMLCDEAHRGGRGPCAFYSRIGWGLRSMFSASR